MTQTQRKKKKKKRLWRGNLELFVTYAAYRGADEGKLQKTDNLTPRRPLTSCQHCQQGAGDDEEGATFTHTHTCARYDESTFQVWNSDIQLLQGLNQLYCIFVCVCFSQGEQVYRERRKTCSDVMDFGVRCELYLDPTEWGWRKEASDGSRTDPCTEHKRGRWHAL